MVIEDGKQNDVDRFFDCSYTSYDFLNKYRPFETYIPYNDDAPIIFVKIHINIWQKGDGTGNWQNTPEQLAKIDQMVYWLNNNFIGKNIQPSHPLPSYPHVSDTKIRFEHQTFFYRVDTLHGNDYLWVFNEHIRENHPERLEGINIHVVSAPGITGGRANHPIYFDDNQDLIILVRNSQQKPETLTEKAWSFTQLIAHELGHSFNLGHTYYSNYSTLPEDYDFLWDILELEGQNIYFCYDPQNGICYHKRDWNWDVDDYDSGCTNNLMGGTKEAGYKSPLQVGKMRHALHLKTTRKYAYGYHEVPFEITQDETWDFSIKFYQDLVITPGATLTVKCDVQMVSEAKIVVKPGGQLIIDGGRIGTDYFAAAPWHGIYVEGDRTKPQSFENQGALILKNGAIIENSKYGVLLRGADTEDNEYNNWHNNGGIVQATDAIFRNNWRNVGFYAYPDNNISYFRNCTFETDDNTIHTSHTSNLSMWSVQDVRITNCNFIDSRSDLSFENARYGIYTSSASFIVSKSNFDNMKYGIYSTSSTSNRNFRVSHSEFSSYRGIYFSGKDNVQIFDNDFFVQPGYDYSDPRCTDTYGLYVEYAQNFKIENNVFSSNSNGSTVCGSIGLIARGTGSYTNEIYRNDFSGFTVGIEAIDHNRGRSNSQGLELLCNRLENNAFDFYVTYDIGGRHLGVRALQGFDHHGEKPAGNLFGNDSPILVSNFVNECEHIHYFHHNPASEPRVVPSVYSEDKISLWPLVWPYDHSTSCPRKTWLRPIEEVTLVKEYARSQYEEKSLQLKKLIDAGDSDYLKTSIEEAGPGVNIPLYRFLIEIAPFLSEDVLAAIAEKEKGFNHAMIRNMLVKSPQAPKLANVVEKLDNRKIPLPPPMRQEIELGWEYFGEKEQLEQETDFYKRKHDLALNEIIMNISHETEGWEEAPDIKEVLSKTDDIRYQYLLAELYFEQDNFEQGMQVLKYIESEFSNDSELAWYNDYVSFYSLLHQYNTDEYAGLSQLPVEKLKELEAYLDSGNRIAGKALALLILNNAIEYEELILYPKYEIEPKSGTAENLPINDGAKEMLTKKQFTLYPNPGYDYIMLDWCLDSEIKGTGTIEIYNAAGVLLHSMNADNNCSRKQLQLSTWKSGHYTAVFKWNNNVQKSINFIIAK